MQLVFVKQKHTKVLLLRGIFDCYIYAKTRFTLHKTTGNSWNAKGKFAFRTTKNAILL